MGLFARILKKIRHRGRPKGVARKVIDRPGRNRKPDTAVDLWERTFRFKETPPARAGTKRRIAREKIQKRNNA